MQKLPAAWRPQASTALVDAVPMLSALTVAIIVLAVIWFVIRGWRRKRRMRARMRMTGQGS